MSDPIPAPVPAPIPLICVLGPTATGKTRLAALLAAAISGEIVSADSRQVYRGMDIGTGKDMEDYLVDGRRIPAHLINIVDPGYEYNVFEFKRDGVAAIRDVHARGRLPILCGGTGLYLSAILQDYQLLAAPPDPERHAALTAMTTETLVVELASHGPLHNTSDVLDRKRLIRAIEIAEADPTARSPSIALDAHVFGIRRDRSELRERITRRLTQRLSEGLVDEVRELLQGGLTHDQLSFYGLEYRHVTDHVLGKTTHAQMFAELNSAIHQFAKRQDTWFRRMGRQGVKIHWLDGQEALDTRVKRVQQAIAEG